ncbi:Serine/threonine-protein kinase/endoribonuclease IRE1 [Nosema bombycis CQ1]|uniref:Serine/threonine-protein kinase/endoribonuclease IRE1 n=1 Tax=Nosema bombycis (strain CQ1 / CVCC 102059) TaxID=578461 RepID=R0MMH2_NOSB1|nr:Serine/threonine-protein kinase/endoribonuclease IRE1 [Nosema bombycis CQ1]|eukprot:EOB14063.1 Serine/threonine-protein kinase/endoribonuclease IRE1 [Nosema bombycis CQ1]
MNRLYFYSGLEVYYPKEYGTSFTFLYLILLILIIFIFLIKRKSVKIVLELEKNESYTLYEGLYMHKRVLIKWYKKRKPEITKEIQILQEVHNNLYISRLVYYEDNYFNTFLVFEYLEEINSKLTKAMLHQIVLAVKFLNEKNIFLKNFNPKNIRIQNGHTVLFNVGVHGDNKGWYSECQEDDKIKNVFFLGCLLHYFITGYHPYDKRGLEKDCQSDEQSDLDNCDNRKDKDSCDNVKKDKDKCEYKVNDLNNHDNNISNLTFLDHKSIQDNILLKKYKIRIEDPLVHDLIYHTIKAKIPERTSLQRLSAHPFFWDDSSKFEFIARYSDILEGNPIQVKKIERNKTRIFTKPWNSYLCSLVSEELSVFRLYNFNSARDLIRVIRNKGRHYNQIPGNVKEVYRTFPGGFMSYWCGLFPGLLIVCYNCGYQLRTNELLEKFY